jgi:hypothetical protein
MLDTVRAEVYQGILNTKRYKQWEAVVGASTIVEQVDQCTLYDGYTTEPTRTYDANSISLQTLFTFASEKTATKIRELLTDMLPHHAVHLHAVTTILTGVPTMHTSDRNKRHCFVEVGGRHSTISLIEKSKITGVITVPHGTLELFRTLSPEALSYAEAQQRAFMLAEQHETVPDTEGVKVLQKWAQALFDCIPELTGGVTPPERVSVLIDQPLFPWYAQALGVEWVQPGIRDERAFTVFPAIEPSAHPSKEKVDERIITLCTAVHEWTQHL